VTEYWLVDAKFRRLCDAMCDDQARKVSHVALFSVKGRSRFLACRRQILLSTGVEGYLHKVCIDTKNRDSKSYMECIGVPGSVATVSVFRPAASGGSTRDDELSDEEGFVVGLQPMTAWHTSRI
jgi:hypothetical protein